MCLLFRHVLVICLFGLLARFAPLLGQTPSKTTKTSSKLSLPDAPESFFGLTNLWTLHLRVESNDWASMEIAVPAPFRPQGRVLPGPIAPNIAGPPRPIPPDRLPLGRQGFESRFKYVPATLEFNGEKHERVGLRFKGNSSFGWTRGSIKHPFKIDFNRYVKGGAFLGMTKLNLNNNAMDASQMREALACQAFRDAGIASPRTAFARVYLSVPGKFENQYLGLYTLVEQVSERFLKDHFGTKQGLLLKPEGAPGFRNLGNDWETYKRAYRPKTDWSAEESEHFIAFTQLVNQAEDRAFRDQIASFVNVDQTLRFLAVNAILANQDSFLSAGHNFYIYLRPPTHQIEWIPWDLNLAFANTDLSIERPHHRANRLIERMLAIKEFRDRYRKHVEEILAAAFQPAKFQARIHEIAKVLQTAMPGDPIVTLRQFQNAVGYAPTKSATETVASKSAPPGMPAVPRGAVARTGPPLLSWIVQRMRSINDQLAGKSEGRQLDRGGPMAFNIVAMRAMQEHDRNGDRHLTAVEFKAMADTWFANADLAKLGSITPDQLASGMNVMFGMPAGFGRHPQPPIPGLPFGRMPFGQAGTLALHLFSAADGNHDSKLTRAELQSAVDGWFLKWDSQKNGLLSLEELSAGLNSFPGHPPM